MNSPTDFLLYPSTRKTRQAGMPNELPAQMAELLTAEEHDILK